MEPPGDVADNLQSHVALAMSHYPTKGSTGLREVLGIYMPAAAASCQMLVGLLSVEDDPAN